MSQEYDINEYWEQFDEKTRWVGFKKSEDKKLEMEEKESDDLIKTLDWVIQNEEEKTNDPPVFENKCENETKVEETVLTTYGLKRKRNNPEEVDLAVREELNTIFEKMKQTVK